MTGGPAPRPQHAARIMDGLDGLNPEQRAAVEQTDGPVLILAGAGSGKTRVIAYRIAHLIGSGLAQEREVLAVTFTNKAAEEMRQRVAGLLGHDVRGLWISTFHALCAKLLRREGPAIGLGRDFVIYDSADQQSAIKQALKDVNADDKLIPPRMALSRISQAKNQMQGPEAMAGTSSWNFRDQQIAKVYERYVAILKESGAVDFDDLLLKTVELFDKAEHVRKRYATQFSYISIDEYQDTNRPQYLLVQQLASVHGNLAVVGDPDQSIYKWRGADVKNILDFERDYPNALIVRLEQNYRSTQVILDAASAVIRQNRQRKDKKLWTDRSGGEKIVYTRTQDELEEADFVLRTIRDQLADDTKNIIAVLYRMNAQSRAIEDALTREGLPYRMVGGVRFYERKEVKDALAYLKLIINPHDDVSFRRVVNVPTRGIGKVVMDALDAADPTTAGDGAPPLMAAGLFDEEAARRSLWAKARHVLDNRGLTPARARVAQGVRRDHHRRAAAGRRPHRLRDHRAGDGEVRLLRGPARGEVGGGRRAPREPGRARLRRARVRAARAGRLARRLRRSPVAALRGRRVVRRAERPRLADDHARRQGPRVPRGHHARDGGRPVPAQPGQRGRSRPRGRAAPLLRRHHPRREAPVPVQRLTPPRLRRVPAHRALAVPGRDPQGAGRGDRGAQRRLRQPPPAVLRDAGEPVRPASGVQLGLGRASDPRRDLPARREAAVRGPERPATRARPPTRPGVASSVRRTRTSPPRRPAATRPACASGIRSSASARSSPSRAGTRTLKLIVRFASVGQKKLMARFANLAPA